MNYPELSFKNLLELIGKKENIVSLTHCVTRLRFILKDESKADVEAIKQLKFTKGCISQGGQFQIIVGTDVEKVYQQFLKVNQLESLGATLETQSVKQDGNIIKQLLSHISQIFIPLLPAIIAGGLILGFRNLIGDIEFGGATLTENSQFWSGVHDFLWLIGQAIFAFLPVAITWSVSRKMGGSQILGIVLGLTMISPLLLPPVQMAQGVDVEFWDFGFAQLARIGYQNQVVPAILAAMALVYIERGLKKIIPSVVSLIFVPFITIITAVLLTHALIGPIGRFIGDGIGDFVGEAIVGPYSIVVALVFGLLYAPIVITGLHYVFPAVNMQLIATLGATPLFPLVALSNISQASASFGVALMNKNKEEREVSIPATISGYLGVTEPAMYGVNLRYKFAFYSAMIGSGIACATAAVFGVMANSIGVGGLPAILSIQGEYWLAFAIAMLLAVLIPLILTIVIYKTGQKTGKLDITEVN